MNTAREDLERIIGGTSLLDRQKLARLTVLLHIQCERDRQDAKWKDADAPKDLLLFCAVLGEEMGEVHKAALELRAALHRGARMGAVALRTLELREELIQVAAVAAKIVEAIDRDLLTIDAPAQVPASIATCTREHYCGLADAGPCNGRPRR